ncbi:MAG: 30S ribosomal protein S27e [Nanoarchaeota archaeon]
MQIWPKNKSKFLKIACPRCYNNQIIFGKSALAIKCEKCNKLLIKTTGGKAKIKAKIKKIWN